MTLPVAPSAFLARVIDPGLDRVASVGAISQGRSAARQFLLAVALQETGLAHRAQVVAGNSAAAGPARGWWQFELPTVGLLMRHHVSGSRLAAMAADAWVRFEADDIWRAIEGNDFLAVGVARVALLTDPHPIPVTLEDGWRCYADRIWRPGKPKPNAWLNNWRIAQSVINGG